MTAGHAMEKDNTLSIGLRGNSGGDGGLSSKRRCRQKEKKQNREKSPAPVSTPVVSGHGTTPLEYPSGIGPNNLFNIISAQKCARCL